MNPLLSTESPGVSPRLKPNAARLHTAALVALASASASLLAQPVPPPQEYVNAVGQSPLIAPAVPQLAPTGACTLEIWIFPTESASNRWIIGKALEGPNGVDPYQSFSLMTAADGGRIVFAVSTGSPGSYRSIISAASAPVNRWTHLAATLSGTEMKLYLNGVLAASGQSIGPIAIAPATPLSVGIAKKSDGSTNYSGFVGYARSARFWSVARSQLQINQGLHVRLPQGGGLVGAWPLEEATGEVARDVSGNGLDLSARGGVVATKAAILEQEPFYEFIQYANLGVTLDGATDVIPIDYNQDGYPDVVVSRLGETTFPETRAAVRFFRNNAGASLQSDPQGARGDLTMVHPRAWQVADFNRDGRQDLLITGHGTDMIPFPGEQSKIFMGSAGGVITEESHRLPAASLFTHGAASGDVNGDGYPDIFMPVMGVGTKGSAVYLNDPGRPGYFSVDYVRIPADINAWRDYTAALLADLNGDGRPDLVLGTQGAKPDEVLFNNGLGFFTRTGATALPPRLFPGTGVTVEIVAADLNRDGFQDLILATTGGILATPSGQINGYERAGLQVLLGRPGGRFVDATAAAGIVFTTAERWVRRVLAEDINADGNVDLILQVLTDSGTRHRVFLGDGAGGFLDATFFLRDMASGPACIIDLNRDGKKDLVVSGYNSLQAVIGRGTLTLELARRVLDARAGPPPVITDQPSDLPALAGGSHTLSVSAQADQRLSYQWQKDGINLAGATNATYSIPAAAATDAGVYTVLVGSSSGTTASRAAAVTVLPASALANLSVRTTLAAGQTLIVGAVVGGGRKTVLARAGGPALNQFGLEGMADPRLELFTSGATPIASNDDWSGPLAPTFAAVGAFAYANGSKDAAFSQALDGSFTVQAKGSGAGVVLVELYDVTGGTASRFSNVSVRNRVGTGADVLIAGFNIAGSGTKNLLIRGVGPGLNQFGLTGTLADPRIQIYDAANTVVASNDNWNGSLAATFSSVGAFSLPANSRDAAVGVALRAGASYTVVVSGTDGGTGEALVEVYELP